MSADLAPFPEDYVEVLRSLVTIPGPTGDEGRRAEFLVRWLKDAGVEEVVEDEHFNVQARFGPEPAEGWTWFDAHTDTVFPDQDLPFRVEEDRAYCPGVFDNGVAVVHLMMLARELARSGQGKGMLLSFSVGEEGEGDLKGMKTLAGTFPVREAVVFDCGLSSVIAQCVGSRRYEIVFRGPGGHSWGDFGASSAIHGAARWILDVKGWMEWIPKKRSYNVGLIQGGQGVNVIAPECRLKLDVRSLEAAELEKLPEILEGSLKKICGDEGLDWETREIGFRPSGRLEENHRLIQTMKEVHQAAGLEMTMRNGSTNVNWLFHCGIDAISSGVANGSGVHTREEMLDLASAREGWKKLQLLTKALRGGAEDASQRRG